MNEIPYYIFQGYYESTTVLAPTKYDYWNYICDDEVNFLNDPPLDFVEFSDNLLSIFPSGCTTSDNNYVIEFGFPSYPTFYTKTF